MALESQAAFARRLGKDRAHVTRLKNAGRLVMREGKVVIEETLARLEATESPLPRDIANRERLAAERFAETTAGEPEAIEDQDLAAIGRRFKLQQMRKMEAEAAMAHMERDKLAGLLVATEDVDRAGLELGATVRATLEALPDRYAPELAAASEVHRARAILAEAVELALGTITRELEGLAYKVGAR